MGHRLGRYDITGELGEGGFGRVVRAWDPRLKRPVAIKIPFDQGDPTLISRFRSEAMTAGNLDNNNIVTIHDFDEDNGTQFLVMEYLDGIDLRKIIANKVARESLSLLEKVVLMSEAAQGLQCAHENGVVHRDVKPANIMRLNDGPVKIMDFGIARLTNEDQTRNTRPGLMIGTIDYMAPEQFPPARDVDARCDIWSYGVVFYELLTGVNPFRADDPREVRCRIATEEPPAIASLVPDCPPLLSASVQRLLSKDRSARTQSLDDFLVDLEPIVRGLAPTEVPLLLRRADSLFAADTIEEVLAITWCVLKVDKTNAEGRHLRDCARKRLELRPRIEELLREADQYAGDRKFSAALETLELALRLDPLSSTVRSRIEQIRANDERSRRAVDLITQGRRAHSEGELTEAFSLISEAMEADPGNTDGPRFLNEVKTAMHEREIKAHIAAVLNEANDLTSIQSYEEAIALLSKLTGEHGSTEQVARRLSEARRLKEEQDAKKLLKTGIGHSLANAWKVLNEGRYSEAREIADGLAAKSSDDTAVLELFSEIRTRQKEHERQRNYDRERAEADRLGRSRKYESAIEKIQLLLHDFPDDQALTEDLNRVNSERDLDNHRKAFLQRRIESQRLSDQGKIEEAIAIARELLREYPEDPNLAADLTALQTAIRLREERVKRDADVADLEILLRKGDAQAVIRGAQRILSETNDPRAAALRESAERLLAQTKEIRKQSRKRNPLLWGIGGLVAVVGIAAFLWPKAQPPKQPPPVQPPPKPHAIEKVTVQPNELFFSYVIGGPSPQPQLFRIEAGRPDQAWTVASSDNWLVVPKSKGAGNSDVETRIDTTTLPAGEHTSMISVDVGSAQAAVKVRLRVTPKTDKPGIPGASGKSGHAGENPVGFPQPLPPPPPVDCNPASSAYLERGTLKWTGELAPDADLTISGRNASIGSVRGPLPGCPVEIKLQDPDVKDVSIEELPSATNNFGRIQLKNQSGHPINRIQFTWQVPVR